MINKSREKLIREDRIRLGNPYAHLNDEGELDADIPGIEERVHSERMLLKNQYAFLNDKGGIDGVSLTPKIDPFSIHNPRDSNRALSVEEIEKISRILLKKMWLNRDGLYPNTKEVDALKVIDPIRALEAIGFGVTIENSLGQSTTPGDRFEVAGMVDKQNNRIQLSSNFSPEIFRFTAAHELGHAILHETSGLQRDRPLDGPTSTNKSPIEIEANKFASYFLMPRKLVIQAFCERFLTQQFYLDDNTAFALKSDTLESVLSQFESLRTLTKYIAGVETYNGGRFISLSKRFGVSKVAMAIRLEELGLVSL